MTDHFTLFLVSGVNQPVKALRFTSRMGLFVTLQYGMHASLIAMVPWSVQRIIQNLLSTLVERVVRYQHSGSPRVSSRIFLLCTKEGLRKELHSTHTTNTTYEVRTPYVFHVRMSASGPSPEIAVSGFNSRHFSPVGVTGRHHVAQYWLAYSIQYSSVYIRRHYCGLGWGRERMLAANEISLKNSVQKTRGSELWSYQAFIHRWFGERVLVTYSVLLLLLVHI